MPKSTRTGCWTLLSLAFLALAAVPARADLYSMTAGGTITSNLSGDPTIPVGTPWSFQLTYDTAAPDRDFVLTTTADPTFGRYDNAGVPPALRFFHFKAGTYEVTLNSAADFASGEMLITFTTAHAIDINISAPTLFPHLAGGPVSFHADFNAFSTVPIFTSDALPTNTSLGPASFDQSSVTLLPPAGVVTTSDITAFAITRVPEPASAMLACGLIAPLVIARRRRRD